MAIDDATREEMSKGIRLISGSEPIVLASNRLSDIEGRLNSSVSIVAQGSAIEEFKHAEAVRIFRESSAEGKFDPMGALDAGLTPLVAAVQKLTEELEEGGTGSKGGWGSVLGLAGLALGAGILPSFFQGPAETAEPVPETDAPPPPATKRPATPSLAQRAITAVGKVPVLGPIVGTTASIVGNAIMSVMGNGKNEDQGTSGSSSSTYSKFLDMVSLGEGHYNSYNRGTAGDSKKAASAVFGKNLTDMTIGEIMNLQDRKKIFAVGRYQIIPSTLKGAALPGSGLKVSDKFSPKNQDRLAINIIKRNGRKHLKAYLDGKSDDIDAAMLDLAKEWASFPNPKTGRSYYSGKGGNAAAFTVKQTRSMLQKVRAAGGSTKAEPSSTRGRSTSGAEPQTTPTAKNGRLSRSELVSIGGGEYLTRDTAPFFEEMRRAAAADGVKLEVNDAYRTYEEQVEMKRQWTKAGKPQNAATPGRSKHGVGKALDIESAGGTNAAYKWLVKNAARFGFRNTVKGEPWHWEYVGGGQRVASASDVGSMIGSESVGNRDAARSKSRQTQLAMADGGSTVVVTPKVKSSASKQIVRDAGVKYREHFA